MQNVQAGELTGVINARFLSRNPLRTTNGARSFNSVVAAASAIALLMSPTLASIP